MPDQPTASDVFVHETAVVESGATVGRATKIWHHAHVRAMARIGERCVLGKNVFIDAGVVIGSGVHIQNNVSVYAGVELEDDVFVGPSAVFTNDRVPRAGSSSWTVERTIVRRGASIGGNATLVPGIVVGTYAMVAAGAVVTRAVAAHHLVSGVPAVPVALVCRCGATRVRLQEGRSLHCQTCRTELEQPT